MYVAEESDSGIVPMNHSNKIEQSMAESEEGRPLIKENIHQSSTRPTQSGIRVSALHPLHRSVAVGRLSHQTQGQFTGVGQSAAAIDKRRPLRAGLRFTQRADLGTTGLNDAVAGQPRFLLLIVRGGV
jgi:hypothetical protein